CVELLQKRGRIASSPARLSDDQLGGGQSQYRDLSTARRCRRERHQIGGERGFVEGGDRYLQLRQRIHVFASGRYLARRDGKIAARQSGTRRDRIGDSRRHRRHHRPSMSASQLSGLSLLPSASKKGGVQKNGASFALLGSRSRENDEIING